MADTATMNLMAVDEFRNVAERLGADPDIAEHRAVQFWKATHLAVPVVLLSVLAEIAEEAD